MGEKINFKEEIEDFLFHIMNKRIFKTYEDTNKIMVYEPETGIYKPAESTITYECCQSKTVNTPQAKSIIEMNIRGTTYINRHSYSDSVCVKNGVLMFDGLNIKLVDHSPKLIFESQLNIEYFPQAICPVWEATLKSMLPNESDRLLIQEWYAYHFFRGQPFEKAMFFVGKPSTGKSTSLYVLDQLLGGCASHAQLSDFQKDGTYAEANLYGKLGNTYSDMGQATILDVGRFKVLTGSRDNLTARFPYEKPFNFINSAKFTFASNKLPPLSANVQGDMAFWKRVLLIQFSNPVKIVDMSLFDKLRNELSGILNWALEGYKRLKSNGGVFTKNTEDVYSTWNSSAYTLNPLDDFLNNNMVLSHDTFITNYAFKILYERWCTSMNEPLLSQQEIRAFLAQKGIFESTKINKDTGKRDLVYKGMCEI